jgi:hypothetical protein
MTKTLVIHRVKLFFSQLEACLLHESASARQANFLIGLLELELSRSSFMNFVSMLFGPVREVLVSALTNGHHPYLPEHGSWDNFAVLVIQKLASLYETTSIRTPKEFVIRSVCSAIINHISISFACSEKQPPQGDPFLVVYGSSMWQPPSTQ